MKTCSKRIERSHVAIEVGAHAVVTQSQCSTGSARSPSAREVEQLNELMRRYGRGEEGAFEPLYKLVAPRVYRFCLRLTSHRTDADDLLQETFLRLHRARATYLAGANTFYWAFAIARAALIDRLRYWRRRPESLGVASDVAEDKELRAEQGYQPEAELLACDLRHVVTLELGKMSEKNRVAYVLLREEGLSVKEAAVMLGTTVDVVKQRAHRAYEQIRSAVGAAGWIEPGNDKLRNDSRPLRVSGKAFDVTALRVHRGRDARSPGRQGRTIRPGSYRKCFNDQ